MPIDRTTERILHHGPATPYILRDLGTAKPRLKPVSIPVQRHHVATGNDVGHECRPALHLLSDHEERCPCARAREDVQHRRSPLRMGTVVEGQDDAGWRDRSLKRERRRRRGEHGCQQMTDHQGR